MKQRWEAAIAFAMFSASEGIEFTGLFKEKIVVSCRVPLFLFSFFSSFFLKAESKSSSSLWFHGLLVLPHLRSLCFKLLWLRLLSSLLPCLVRVPFSQNKFCFVRFLLLLLVHSASIFHLFCSLLEFTPACCFFVLLWLWFYILSTRDRKKKQGSEQKENRRKCISPLE